MSTPAMMPPRRWGALERRFAGVRSEVAPAVGTRVALRHAPEVHGTVIRSSPTQYRIAWDGHGRKRGQPRSRFTYPASEAHNLTPILEGT